jgi:hypothetical protein
LNIRREGYIFSLSDDKFDNDDDGDEMAKKL